MLKIESYKGVKKMKKMFGFGSVAVACLFLLPIAGNAESATQEADVSVADGILSFEIPKSLKLNFEIDFGEFKKDEYFHPVLAPASYSFTPSPYNYQSDNPYDGDVSIPVLALGKDARDAIVKITNENYSSPEFKVTVQRTGFFHKESGEEMTGVHLYMGRFNDVTDYKGANREVLYGYLPADIEGTNKYWLANHLTIKEGVSSLVADYRGTSGVGERYITPFTPSIRYSGGTLPTGTGFHQYYTEENISLSVDPRTNIPASGTFSTTLTWSVEQTP